MNLYDLAYAVGITAAAPFWLLKPTARRKVLNAFGNRMARVPPRVGNAPAVFIHAVSLGEINATRELIRRLRLARPGLQFIVSATTDTGYARGIELYGKETDVTLVRFPLDFSWVVGRMLDNLRPSVVALMELEVWPNFLGQCRRRDIPVLLINGRLTETSFKRYRMFKPVAAGMFRKLARICAQDQMYAERFIQLGADPALVSVTGTMKFDTAEIADSVAGATELAASVGLKIGVDRIVVCGSTGPGEEQIILSHYRNLKSRFADLRLVIVPRHPQRFDEVAALIEADGFKCIRRSRISPSPGTPGEGRGEGKSLAQSFSDGPHPNPLPAYREREQDAVILGDTMGELRAWYRLADAVFVGRTLVDLGPRQHGSDMIEPAALAKPVIVGPFTGNFSEPMARFLEADAMRVVKDGSELEERIAELLINPSSLGIKAREVVRREQGATDKHVAQIVGLLSHGD
jgi:3-deoxy-D-manno-octulosonic-acid transferase